MSSSTMSNTDRNLRAVNLPTDWAPASWRSRTAVQMPTYPDAEALESALGELRTMLEDEGDLAVRAYARRIGACAVASDFVPPNINSVADLERLARL